MHLEKHKCEKLVSILQFKIIYSKIMEFEKGFDSTDS